jgi:hypothetical protein
MAKDKLDFKCKDCGCTQLEEVQYGMRMHAKIGSIWNDGVFELEESPEMFGDDPPDIIYQCFECGNTVCGLDGKVITGRDELCEYLSENKKRE